MIEDSLPDFRKTRNSEFYITRPRMRANSAYLKSDQSKFSVMRSVAKGIKNVDLTDIVHFQGPRIDSVPEPESLQPQTKSVMTLKEIRKLYDEALTQSVQRDKEYRALQAEHRKLLEQKREFQEVTTDINALNKKVDTDLKKCIQEHGMLEHTVLTYEWVKERLEHDKVVLAKRLYDSQEVLRLKKCAKAQADQKFELTKQLNSQATRMLKHIKNEALEMEQKQRQQLLMYEQRLDGQQKLKDVRAKQEKDISNIADFAMRDKDASEKNWKKLLGAHTMVKIMLRDKMERQMDKFRIVEQAYQSIKMQTGVWQSEEIVQKFLSRDETYGNLLYSIAEAQKKIAACKKKNEELRLIDAKLKDHLNELDKPLKKTEIDLSVEYKLISKNSRKNIASALVKERLFKFCCDELVKLDTLQDRDFTDYASKYTSNDLKTLYTEFCSRVQSIDVRLYDVEEISPLDINVKDKNNVRVKMGGDGSEEEESIADGLEQEQLIQAVRNQLFSANHWFMEEVKKKRQEQLKKKLNEKERLAMKEPPKFANKERDD